MSGRNLGIVHLAFDRMLMADIAGPRLLRIAAVAAAGAIGTVSRADAAYYYWQDSNPTYYQREPDIRARRPVLRRPVKKDVVAQKDTGAKPQGALIIAVSINRQQVKIYDANGFFAQAPVSTGMKGHGTPMGVFSVIQKHKWHHSNIYSGAPMPYMQRITWSGVAMHAGVLPGYPASHGCIRMPEGFAIKMWNWTRMGARVVVTPGEISPASFSHPFLPGMKVQPQPQVQADAESGTPLGAKADKGPGDKSPDAAQTKLDLRPTVGHSDATSPDGASARENTRTADVSSDRPTGKTPATMSDAAPAPKDDVTVDLATKKPATDKSAPQTEDLADAAPKQDDAAAAPEKSVETKPDQAEATPKLETKDAKPGEPVAGKSAADVEADPAKAEKAETKSDAAKAAAAADAKKDETRLPDVVKADVAKADVTKADVAKTVAAKAETAKRAGQISVFISRKDSRLYARQNFEPLFDSPVTIAPSDRPLGTHVFTVDVDRNDPNILHWSVVSLPVSARGQVREQVREAEPRSALRHKGGKAAPVEAKPTPATDSPVEALDRITIPTDVMARITDALTTGGSIIVSDQGINQGETGEGTDFIVSLH